MHVDDASELDGLDAGELSAAREAAKARDLDGYLITLVLPTGHPYLASLTRHDIRDRILTASRSRGSRGGDFDNREVLLEIVRLRAERAKLLGFANHAAVVTADETAGSPEAVAAMLGRLAPAAARNAIAEQVDLQRRQPRRGGRRRGLGLLHREGAAGEVRRRHRRAAPLLRGRARAAGRRVLRRRAALRGHVHRAPRPRAPTTRTRASSRSRRRTARRSASTCSTSTPATRSAAARGWTRSSPSRDCSTTRSSSSTTSTCRSRPRGSRRC